MRPRRSSPVHPVLGALIAGATVGWIILVQVNPGVALWLFLLIVGLIAFVAWDLVRRAGG